MNQGPPVRTDAAVPLVDLVAQQADVNADVMERLTEVFRQAGFIGGPAVAEFATTYAEFLDARRCVGVTDGTDALKLALRASGVGAGGEVIPPANTFIATAEAASRIGAVPVPADVDPEYLLIDNAAVAAAVTPGTRAIVPLFSRTAFVEQLIPVASACGAVIIEDAGQSQGATRFGRSAGTLGLAAGSSFYPGKNLGAAGDAGAVVTDDGGVAARVRTLSSHASSQKYVHDVVGSNSRLDAVQAVVLRAKLAKLETWNLPRRAAAERCSHLLADVPGWAPPREAPGNADVRHLYVVRAPDRDAVLAVLQSAGIQARVHYPVPVHLSGAYAGPEVREGSFPVTERAAGRILPLPLYPHITEAQQERVVRAASTAMS